MGRGFLLVLLVIVLHVNLIFAQMQVKDSDGMVLMEVIDEGPMGSIVLKDTTDALISESNKLYSRNDTLIWNGKAIGSAGSSGGWTIFQWKC